MNYSITYRMLNVVEITMGYYAIGNFPFLNNIIADVGSILF